MGVFVLAAVLVANPMVEAGGTVKVSPHVEFDAGDSLRSYRLFAYVHDVPAAFVELNADKVKANGGDPYWRTVPVAPSVWTNALPSEFEVDCRAWPVGDYRVTLQCHVMDKDGNDRYRPHPFSFSIRDKRTEKGMQDGGHSGFVKVGKRDPAAAQTRFWAFVDGGLLRVRVECDEPEAMAKVSAMAGRKHDSIMIAREECIEINFDPTGRGESFCKIVVRPTGDIADYFCTDDNTGTGTFVCDAKWQSGATASTAFGERSWTADVQVPLGPIARDAAPEWLFSVGRTRIPAKRAEWSIWPADAKGFCKPKTFAKMPMPGVDPSAFAWDLNLDGFRTSPDGGGFVSTAKATLVNRTGDFRLVEARAYLVDTSGNAVASGATKAVGVPTDRVRQVSVGINGAKKGLATLHLEIYSADGRLEAQIVKDVVVEYEPVKIVLAKPCYRDCVFDSMKLDEIAGEIRLEEGVGAPLTVSLAGPGTDEKVEIARAAATNSFSFPFAGKAKGDYFIKAGGATKRVRNLPFRDGEIWIDEHGALRRNGEKFLPFGWFSDQYTEEIPGVTVSQLYDGHLRDPMAVRAECDKSGAMKRILVAGPTISEPDGKTLFDTKGQQGEFTEAQAASIRRFVDAVADHPWFGIYYLCDEPEGRDLNPEWFRRECEFLAEIDPYHPTMMLNYSIEGTERYSAAGAEVNCPDAYPYYFTDGTTRAPRRVAYDKAKAAAAHARCAWLAPQLFDWPTKEPGKVACAPDFDEIREQALLAFAGDARGLLWYTRWSYGGAFTEHLRHGPRLLLGELLETRDVFLSPTLDGELTATSTGPDKTLIAALKRFGGETLIIAVNTSDRDVVSTFAGAGLPAKMYPNGVSESIAVVGGRFSDTLKKFEAKVYYDRKKKFDLAEARKFVYGLEASRRKPGNLAAAPHILTYGELRDIGLKAMPEEWWPRVVASSSQKMGYDLPFAYFLQDGIIDEWPIVPYLTWSPRRDDKSPRVRVEFGGRKRFSKVVLHRCRDRDGRIALKSGRVVVDGRELVAFGSGGCKVELSFPEVEADAVTVEIGEMDSSANCRLISELEVYSR